MKQTVIVAGHVFTLEALNGELTLNGTLSTPQELRALGELVHNVRVTADIQAAAIRRARKDGAA